MYLAVLTTKIRFFLCSDYFNCILLFCSHYEWVNNQLYRHMLLLFFIYKMSHREVFNMFPLLLGQPSFLDDAAYSAFTFPVYYSHSEMLHYFCLWNIALISISFTYRHVWSISCFYFLDQIKILYKLLKKLIFSTPPIGTLFLCYFWLYHINILFRIFVSLFRNISISLSS